MGKSELGDSSFLSTVGFPQPASFNQPKPHIQREYYHLVIAITIRVKGARGGAVGCDTALRSAMSRLRFPTASLKFFIDKFY